MVFSSCVASVPENIITQNNLSVVMVITEDKNGQPLSLSSGFFIKPGIVATNYHVIKGASRGYVKIIGEKEKYSNSIIGIVGIDVNRDLVLLSISKIKGKPLELGDSGKVNIGDEIYVVGNPEGLEDKYSDGIVSGIRSVEADNLFQITAPISYGSGGGPVLNSSGEVVGIAFPTFKEGQNLIFAIPSSYLSKLIQNISIPVSLSSSAEPTREDSIINYSGKGISSEVVGEAFVWDDNKTDNGGYTFTLRNNLREDISKIECLVTFYDYKNGTPVDCQVVKYNEIIPAGLAKRISSLVADSTHTLSISQRLSGQTPETKVSFRVIDFKVVK